MTEAVHHNDTTDKAAPRDTHTDKPNNALAEVQDHQRQNGNVGRINPNPGAAHVDAIFGTPTIHGAENHAPAAAAKETQNAAKPAERSWGQWALDMGKGVVNVTEAVGTGALHSVESLGTQIGHGAVSAYHATVDAVKATPHALAEGARAVEHGAEAFVAHPLTTTEHAAKAVAHGAVAAAEGAYDLGKAGVKAIADHPIESAVIAGAVVAEVVTLGGATPVLATLGAVGAGFTARDTFNAAVGVNRDWNKLGAMFNESQSTPEQVKAAKDALANDVGSAAMDFATLGTGIAVGNAAARALKAGATLTGEAEGVAAAAADVAADIPHGVRIAQGVQTAYDATSASGNVGAGFANVSGRHGKDDKHPVPTVPINGKITQ